jgi:hypothetical protein
MRVMKTLLEFFRYFLHSCMFVTWVVGFYYTWMYHRHRRSDPPSDPRPSDSPLAVFNRRLSDGSRAYLRKATIALLLLFAFVALESITANALRGITAPGG